LGKPQLRGRGIVVCANYNCPGQIVIGGAREAVELAETKCLAYGARRCLPLTVSGPFHTPYLQDAAALLQQHLSQEQFGSMQVPVIFNTIADMLPTGQSIADILTRQIVSPVLFEQSIRRLAELGIDTVIEIGPGKVLSGFVRKTAPQIKCYAIENIASFEQAVKAIKGEAGDEY
jgi:[acyl-carrier-protein] S-malonyltransferase